MSPPPPDPAPVIAFSGVSKDYHGLRPLRIAAFTLAAGERSALLGLDQPMAETFINLVTGATLPDAGDITIFGKSTAAINDSQEWLLLVDRFGIVSTRAVLLEGLSVIQNISMSFTLEIEPPPEDVRIRAASLAREVGLDEAEWGRPAGQLDGGGRIRVHLARALALEPAVLLLEHANAVLSPGESASFSSSVRDIASRRRMALVAVTSDRAFASAVATRVLTLEPATGRLLGPRAGLLGGLFRR